MNLVMSLHTDDTIPWNADSMTTLIPRIAFPVPVRMPGQSTWE